MNEVRKFDTLNREEKLAFFQRCQNLLVQNQPNSEFILSQKTQGTFNKRYFLDLYLKYKGFVYFSENIAILFNKRNYSSLEEAQNLYWDDLHGEPHENPMCYTVDFVTAKMDKSLISEIDSIINRDLKYVCFLRASKVSFFEAEELRNSVKNKYRLL